MASRAGHVLVVDDDEDVRTALRLLLESRGFRVTVASRPDPIPTILREDAPDVVLLDMNFGRDASSGKEGMYWLERLLEADPEAAVVLITAYADVGLAVQAMKHGAADFVVKPWRNDGLVQTVTAALRLRRSRRRPLPPPADEELLGESSAVRRLRAMLEKVAPTDANVLLVGESGTGKELAARALHRLSHRADGPFVAVDVGALPESLFEAELFGHVRGAFTGAEVDRPGHIEAAHGGTLFLDEIANIGPVQQAKLLSVLQRREVVRIGATMPRPVDLRLVAATHRGLHELAGEGRFRADLLYRLRTVEIRLPPLREREGDVELLARYFLRRFAAAYGRPVRGFAPEALARLRAHTWPGNVRELEHAVERAVVLVDGAEIREADLSLGPEAEPLPHARTALGTFDLEAIEREVIREALAVHEGNVSRAAAALGLTRPSLYRRIAKYGL